MFSKDRLKIVFFIFATLISIVFREIFILQIVNNDENTQEIINQNFETFYIPAPKVKLLISMAMFWQNQFLNLIYI